MVSKVVYKHVDKAELCKPQMVGGFADRSLPDFDPLLTSSMLKPDMRREAAETEYIDSFLESADCLAREIKSKTVVGSSGEVLFKPFFSNSLVLPAVYICRHVVELAMKEALGKWGVEYQYTHSLCKLWESVEGRLAERVGCEEGATCAESMAILVETLDDIDERGTKLRYAICKNAENLSDSFMWVNVSELVGAVRLFVAQLRMVQEAKR